MKIAIFGGSFNPIHNGHTKLAKHLVDKGIVDRVWLMPTPCSPFKVDKADNVDAFHRYNMVKIACATLFDRRIQASNYEMVHFSDKECVYTVDTLKRLVYEDLGEHCGTNIDLAFLNKFYFVVGADTFNDIEKFKDSDWLLNSGIIKLIVFGRPGVELNKNINTKNCIFVDDVELVDISSSEIRESFSDWSKPSQMKSEYIDTHVMNYIFAYKLYKKK